MKILPRLTGPADLRGLSPAELTVLADELRQTIVATVASTGGHLGSSLGVVELTIALHRLFESPRDKIVWDTGHQAYAHKLLTGRLDRFETLRRIDGIGGFPRRSESPHDVFDGGHAGTGLSIAQGLAVGRDLRHGSERIAVVVGDAALMTGLSLEALNDIGHRQTRLLIVLNDNEMSISPSVGAMSRYLSEIKMSHAWAVSKTTYDRLVEKVPVIGPSVLEWSRRFRKSVVSFAQPGQLFEDLGITYVGVVDGHDLHALERSLRSAIAMEGPVLVHVRTRKGKGFGPAETDQVSFHGAALPPMQLSPAADTYESRTAAAQNGDAVRPAGEPPTKVPNYTHFFATEVVAVARADRRVVAITAGMPTGTGLSSFAAAFPERFYDVGIAEQHAVTLATGLALDGFRPVVAIYSTFLQRAFDQLVHDVCQNDVPVLIGVDRAGLVGEDGTSHQGMFQLPAQLQLPHLIVASPCDEQELRALVRTAMAADHPFAIHYPRDAGFGVPEREPEILPIGSGEVMRTGSDMLIVGFGPITARGVEAADALQAEGWSVGVVNARFAKPLDRSLILSEARGKRLVVTLEESAAVGGFGAAVLEAIEESRATDATYRDLVVRVIGIPADRFVDHGSVTDLRRLVRLDAAGIADQIREALAEGRIEPGARLTSASTAELPGAAAGVPVV